MSPVTPPFTLFEKTTRWFERAKAALLSDLPCRRGCAHCCVGLFSVTILDRGEIQRGLGSLPHRERETIQHRAAVQVSIITVSAPQLADDPFIDRWPDGELDSLAEQFSKLPCPALGLDGSCGLYACRPLACRSMGIPVESNGVVHGACGIQSYVPVVRLTRSLRHEETFLAGAEAGELARLRDQQGTTGEELWLPFAFVPDSGESPLGGMA